MKKLFLVMFPLILSFCLYGQRSIDQNIKADRISNQLNLTPDQQKSYRSIRKIYKVRLVSINNSLAPAAKKKVMYKVASHKMRNQLKIVFSPRQFAKWDKLRLL